jgi:hypothetical protein
MSAILSAVSAAAGDSGGTPSGSEQVNTNTTGATSGGGGGQASSWATNLGLVGGAADSLGINMGAWFDRAQKGKALKQAQANLDREFEENQRRYGLEWALKDFAARKQITIEQAQLIYSQASSQLVNSTNMRAASINEQNARIDLEQKRQNAAAAKAFTRGFAQGMHQGV